MDKPEFVALLTFAPDDMFYEEGAIYSHEPHCSHSKGARELAADEHTANCSRCGQRFAATEDKTAEANRDLHFDGDEDIPSICLNFPVRRDFTVVGWDERVMAKAAWRADLQTSVRSLSYDFISRTGTLVLPAMCCTDMTGAIDLFTAIDPHVQVIATVADDASDTTYMRTAKGWQACRRYRRNAE
jgi:hypothetical protein